MPDHSRITIRNEDKNGLKGKKSANKNKNMRAVSQLPVSRRGKMKGRELRPAFSGHTYSVGLVVVRRPRGG